MTSSKKGVANYATDKPTLGKKADTAEQPTEKTNEPAAVPDLPIEQTEAFDAGRNAKRHGIDRLDAPFADGDDKDAWLKGYDFEPDQI